jgi:hypothetical protein
MDKETEQLLTYDPIAETEKQFGNKHWSEFNDMESMFSLLNAMEYNQKKKEHLKKINDTYYGITWNDFKELLKEKGFQKGLSYQKEYKHFEPYTKEEFVIYYHKEKGLIVWAESYNNMTTINSGKLYGEIEANSKKDEETIWRWLATGGKINSTERVYTTSHDIREGLFSMLDTLETAGHFLPKWIDKKRFLWFVDYIESKVENYDYEERKQPF